MRVALIAIAIAVASSPATAAPSCMTQSEARQKFPNAHLWWHGPNHCWDATPSRHQLAQRIRAKQPKAVQADAQGEPDVREEKQPDAKKKPGWSHEPRWREAMSRMRPEDIPGVQARASASASAEPVDTSPPRMNWRDRWVELVPRAPPVTGKSGPGAIAADAGEAQTQAYSIVTPVRVMLGLLVLVLTLGVFELLFRREWRS